MWLPGWSAGFPWVGRRTHRRTRSSLTLPTQVRGRRVAEVVAVAAAGVVVVEPEVAVVVDAVVEGEVAAPPAAGADAVARRYSAWSSARRSRPGWRTWT